MTRLLGVMAAGLAVASLAAHVVRTLYPWVPLKPLNRLLTLSGEANLPTFFSLLLMVIATLLLAMIAVLRRRRGQPWIGHWTALAFGFLYLAFDEGYQVHESLAIPVRELVGHMPIGFFAYSWVPGGILIATLVGVFFAGFLRALPPGTRRGFMLAATLYLGGALGMEIISSQVDVMYGRTIVWHLLSHLEETLEMAGLIAFIHVLLVFLANGYGGFRLGIRDD